MGSMKCISEIKDSNSVCYTKKRKKVQFSNPF